MGADHRCEARCAHCVGQRELMPGIAPGMKKGDGTAAKTGLPVPDEPLLQIRAQLQRRHHLTIRIQTPIHLLHGRHQ